MTGHRWPTLVISLLAFLYVFRQCLRLRSVTSGLTLASTWKWTVTAVALGGGLMVARIVRPNFPPQADSALQYLLATLALTPLVDILGARRPGHQAWPWFVVLPLVVVLQSSCLTQLIAGRAAVPVEIATPTALGWLLVLMMGAGNHFGTSNTTAAVLGATGLTCLLLPVTEWRPFPSDGLVAAGAVLVAIASWLITRRFRSSSVSPDSSPPINRLWADFRDLYGMVWAKRVVDRVNQFAARERWNVTLTLDGFRPISPDVPAQEHTRDGTSANPEVLVRPTEVLCWVLRRFADESFVRRYLPDFRPKAGSRSEN